MSNTVGEDEKRKIRNILIKHLLGKRDIEPAVEAIQSLITKKQIELLEELEAEKQFYDGENWDDGSVTRNAYEAIPLSVITKRKDFLND